MTDPDHCNCTFVASEWSAANRAVADLLYCGRPVPLGELEEALGACSRPYMGTSTGLTPLHLAVLSGHLDAASLLLERGHPLAPRDLLGRTPLHLAASSSRPCLVQLLLDEGHPLHLQDGKGATPLHSAARYRAEQAARLLLGKGAHPLVADGMGRTALQCYSGRPSAAIYLLLAAAAASPPPLPLLSPVPLPLPVPSSSSNCTILDDGEMCLMSIQSLDSDSSLPSPPSLPPAAPPLVPATLSAAPPSPNPSTAVLSSSAPLSSPFPFPLPSPSPSPPPSIQTPLSIPTPTHRRHNTRYHLLLESSTAPQPHPGHPHDPLLWTTDHRLLHRLLSTPRPADLVQLRLLLAATPLPFMACSLGWTPLHLAAAAPQPAAMELLLRSGHPLHVVARHGVTPLHHSASHAHPDAIRVLLRYRHPLDCRTAAGWTPLHCADAAGSEECAAALLFAGASPFLPLHRLLTPLPPLSPELPVTLQQPLRTSSSLFLHFASRFIASSSPSTISSTSISSSPTTTPSSPTTTPSSDSPSIAAPCANDVRLTRLFPIPHQPVTGLLPSAATTNGTREPFLEAHWSEALQEAYRLVGSPTEKVSADHLRGLLDRCEKPFMPDPCGWTLLHHAALHGHCEAMAMLLVKGHPVQPRTRYDGATPLHLAIYRDLPESVHVLLKFHHPLSPADDRGRTPLHLAAACNCLETLRLLPHLGHPLECRTGGSWTPLHYAAYNGQIEAAASLAVAGSDPLARTARGQLPRDLAPAAAAVVAQVLLSNEAKWALKKASAPSKPAFRDPHIAAALRKFKVPSEVQERLWEEEGLCPEVLHIVTPEMLMEAGVKRLPALALHKALQDCMRIHRNPLC